MGVHGMTRYLQQEGILPRKTNVCCCPPFWNQHQQQQEDSTKGSYSHEDEDSPHQLWSQAIPPNSTLLIDGNGLAFYLHSIAYARHLRSMAPNSSSPSSCPSISQLLVAQQRNLSNEKDCITPCIPLFLPLSVLATVTKEFVTTLLDDKLISSLHFYWDGPNRRFKTLTDRKRKEQRQYEWSMLHRYCEYHALPGRKQSSSSSSSHTGAGKDATGCCHWKAHFPYSNLFLHQVETTILQLQQKYNKKNKTQGRRIHMMYCNEEADVELAKACAATAPKNGGGGGDCFVLGQDSDFFFYKNIRYIPFDTLEIRRHHSQQRKQTKQLWAHVYTRVELARALNLLKSDDQEDDDEYETDENENEDDSLLVEMAILLGNDYVDPKTLHISTNGIRGDPDALIHFLQESINSNNKREIQVSGKNPEALQFVRALYNLNDLESFPIHNKKDILLQDEDEEYGGLVPCIPNDFPIHLLQQPFTNETNGKQTTIISNTSTSATFASIQDTVLQTLQAYVHQHQQTRQVHSNDSVTNNNNKNSLMFRQEHLDAYKQSMTNNNNNEILVSGPQLRNPPQWKDVLAADLIERCIQRTLRASSFEIISISPEDLFSHLNFHSSLEYIRRRECETTATPRAVGNSNPTTTTATKRTQQVLDENYNEDYDDEDFEKQDNESPPPKITLPIDEYEGTILQTIQRNRVTIIHGETGCGKSSRVPIMILKAPPPDPNWKKDIKLFISQPRRIAAKALVERVRSCEPTLKDAFALRMGHGWREYETYKTQAWFVTAGYLVRLLAKHSERFDDCSHLIIDEVHERSVDTDILCLLCKRLLERNHTIRLVLMSATLATKLYQDYFSDMNPNHPPPTIHVGVRRFPIQEFFVEDLVHTFHIRAREAKAASAIVQECENGKCRSAPPVSSMQERFLLASYLATIVGQKGSSVLIFVPGMAEIIAITELIEGAHVVGKRFTCFPIHSDIPFEDQMAAFDKPAHDEVKVIIATNAAESSVTLPDVDHVICLGLCRQIMYNAASHRQVLVPCWISRASATQRAGRTGRVRPGNVYRLYTQSAYSKFMDEFEPGEMVRIPLDHVILMLKQMLHEEVTPALLGCIEPPDIDTIGRSFDSLHKWNFITEPNDVADITTLGNFVSSLGVDLSLGALIGLGIQFGVAAEAIEMAAVLSFPKSPFKIAHPLKFEPAEYNKLTTETYVSKCHFDAKLYSEPFALMNCMWDYGLVSQKWAWCKHYGIAAPRMKQLVSIRNSLRKRVSEFLAIDEERLQLETPPVFMPLTKLHILRILQVWVFSDAIIERKALKSPPSKTSRGNTKPMPSSCRPHTISLPEGSPLTEYHLNQVLRPDRHPYKICNRRNIQQEGSFEHEQTQQHKNGKESTFLSIFIVDFEKRLLSYAIEKGFPLVWCWDEFDVVLYIEENEGQNKFSFMNDLIKYVADDPDPMNSRGIITSVVLAERQADSKTRRGIFERTCGSWSIRTVNGSASTSQESSAQQHSAERQFRKIHFHTRKSQEFNQFHLEWTGKAFTDHAKALMTWEFCAAGHKRKKKKMRDINLRPRFVVSISGDSCSKISMQDIKDLLSSSNVEMTSIKDESKQDIVFPHAPHKPLMYSGHDNKNLATTFDDETASWNQPHQLIDDIPEGARLLEVLASCHRRGGHCIRFEHCKEDTQDNQKNQTTMDQTTADIFAVRLKKHETCISYRWRRLDTDLVVFVNENTVPASATSTSNKTLFACCANTLEVNGGGLRAEGLTLLPPNPLFLLLSFLTFGVAPVCANMMRFDLTFNDEVDSSNDEENQKHVNKLMQWLQSQCYFDNMTTNETGTSRARKRDAMKRLDMAIKFHKECLLYKEDELICFPDNIRALCDIFGSSSVAYETNFEVEQDDIVMSPWDSLEETSLTFSNLNRWRSERKKRIATTGSTLIKSAKSSHQGKALQKVGDDDSRDEDGDAENVVNDNKTGLANPQLLQLLTSMMDGGGKKGSVATERDNRTKAIENEASANKSSDNDNDGCTESVNTGSIRPLLRGVQIKCFPKKVVVDARRLFVTELQEGEQLKLGELVSTNILSLLFKEYGKTIDNRQNGSRKEKVQNKKKGQSRWLISLQASHWTISSFTESKLTSDNDLEDVGGNDDGPHWYQAKFLNTAIPLQPIKGRGKNKLPKWIKKRQCRPNRVEDVLDCIPRDISKNMNLLGMPLEARIVTSNRSATSSEKTQNSVLFNSIDAALRMEAAFWLERQFCTYTGGVTRHWYNCNFHEMMELLTQNLESAPS